MRTLHLAIRSFSRCRGRVNEKSIRMRQRPHLLIPIGGTFIFFSAWKKIPTLSSWLINCSVPCLKFQSDTARLFLDFHGGYFNHNIAISWKIETLFQSHKRTVKKQISSLIWEVNWWAKAFLLQWMQYGGTSSQPMAVFSCCMALPNGGIGI